MAIVFLPERVPAGRVIPMCNESYEGKSNELATCGMGDIDGYQDPSVLQELIVKDLRRLFLDSIFFRIDK